MCGRFALSDTQQLSLRFDVAPGDERSLLPRYNIAPTQAIPVVVSAEHARVLRFMRWGLRPSWKRAVGRSPDPINARAETLIERPMFRPLLAARRCLIPSDGFYEWKSVAGSKFKQPYFFRLRNRGVFAFAGLYSPGAGGTDDPPGSCAIITTTANGVLAGIHDRMPAILRPQDEEAWLDRDLTAPDPMLALLQPYEADRMEGFPVSDRVSSPGNDGPSLIEPLAP
jgi:putative SOS response-associated peptidase YedK